MPKCIGKLRRGGRELDWSLSDSLFTLLWVGDVQSSAVKETKKRKKKKKTTPLESYWPTPTTQLFIARDSRGWNKALPLLLLLLPWVLAHLFYGSGGDTWMPPACNTSLQFAETIYIDLSLSLFFISRLSVCMCRTHVVQVFTNSTLLSENGIGLFSLFTVEISYS